MKTTEQIIADYKAAYQHANGKLPPFSYHKGWFTVNGMNYRRAEILTMTMSLLARPSHWERGHG